MDVPKEMNYNTASRIIVGVCFIVLPLLILGITSYQSSTDNLFGNLSIGKALKERKVSWNETAKEEADVHVLQSDEDEKNQNITPSPSPTTTTIDQNKGDTLASSLTNLSPAPTPTTSSLTNLSPAPTPTTSIATDSKRSGSSGNSSSPSPSPSPFSTTAMDKLLDGLLAEGFYQESCLSRYQSYLYRKPSAFKPSQHLTSRLRSYEELHRKCGPQTKHYRDTMKKLSKSPTLKVSETTECKYIVWLPANGLGNRMVSLVSVFLYALLSNRVLLVEFGHDMSGLFCEPFLNSTWELPHDFPRRHHFGDLPTYENTIKKVNIMDSNATNSVLHLEKIPSMLFLNLQHAREEHERYFHCDQGQHFLSNVPALVLRSDQYFVPSLFMTPSFQDQLSLMFPDKETVFHHLGRYLFHPTNLVWGFISRFYQAYLSRADERIGIQIRAFTYATTPTKTILDQLLACTLQNKLLPEINDHAEADYYPPENQTSKAVLVTSLYPEYAENLRAMYWSKPTRTGEAVGVYQPTHEGKQKFNNNTHEVKALTEIYLLSLCDVLVTSGQSTFGYVAQGLSGLKPWVMPKTSGIRVPNPPCVRALSIDPCFHYPPMYDCRRKSKVDHISSVFENMKMCVDIRTGVAMVGND